MKQILVPPVRRGWVRSGLQHSLGSHTVGCGGRRREGRAAAEQGHVCQAGLPFPRVCRCCKVGGWALGRTEMNLAVLDLFRLGLTGELKKSVGVSEQSLSFQSGGGAVPGQCRLLWMAGQASW